MSDARMRHGAALNWRGPLLAAAIFAAVFAILLMIAHQNESNTSDMGSSLRQDPYGTSLLFDAYARAGYQVERSESAKDKVSRGGKFRRRLEDFLARGGRVVLVASPLKLKSQSQGWEIENQ